MKHVDIIMLGKDIEARKEISAAWIALKKKNGDDKKALTALKRKYKTLIDKSKT